MHYVIRSDLYPDTCSRLDKVMLVLTINYRPESVHKVWCFLSDFEVDTEIKLKLQAGTVIYQLHIKLRKAHRSRRPPDEGKAVSFFLADRDISFYRVVPGACESIWVHNV